MAEAYGVHSTQIRKWRRLYRDGQLVNAAASAMLAVHIAEGAPLEKRSRASKPQRHPDGAIQKIEFESARVSTEGKADAETVRAVLKCLAG